MDNQIKLAFADAQESFIILNKLQTPQRHYTDDNLKNLKQFHKTRIKSNLFFLTKEMEKL